VEPLILEYEKSPDKTQLNHAPMFKIAEEFSLVTTQHSQSKNDLIATG
jgi:hypothetical protein